VGPLVKFFSLTYAVTWTFFLTAVALSRSAASTDQTLAAVPGLLVLLGTIAPALVALLITARADGSPGVGTLLQRMFQWRVGARWYLFAVSFMVTIKFTVALAYRIMAGSWPDVSRQSLGIILISIVISTPLQSGEEIGWRGYALPRLAERMGFARGSLLLGLIWACWHLPIFFLRVPGNDEFGQSFPVWALGVTALSVAIAWLYTHANESLLLPMLMHSTVNNIPHFLPATVATADRTFSLHASLVAWLTTVILCIPAGYFLVRMRHVDLSRVERQQASAPTVQH
jgi:membrane protease YdiL (CAAX protease family)